MTNDTPSAPAGWYPAPHAGNRLRYWDGKAWLDIAPPEPQGQRSPTAAASAAIPAQQRIPEQRPVDLGASIAPNRKPRRWPLVVIPLAIVVLIGAGVVHFVNNPPASSATGYTPKPKPPGSSAQKPQVPAAVELPAGFQDSGAGVAMKFLDRECSLSIGGCAHIEVFALEDCVNSVYVELNVLDASGAVIGFTNDTVASLREGQRAIMEFNVLEDGVARVEVVDVNCY